MDIPKTFGEYVRITRERQGISAIKLADRIGKHTTTLTRVENGFIAVPTPDYFMDLVDALNLDIIKAMNLLGPYQRIYQRIVTALEVK